MVFKIWVQIKFTSRPDLGTDGDKTGGSMAEIAYIRVSCVDQNTERQLADCKISFRKIFVDKMSGKDTKRVALTECLNFLREGDTLHVHSIDRFARNLRDLQSMIHDLVKRDISVFFHKENLIFSPSKTNPMHKFTLQIMGAFAEFEREIIRERQREGIEKAKKAGKYGHKNGGRKKSLDRQKIRQLRKDGFSYRKISTIVGCSLSSVQRIMAEETKDGLK
jgi:DNA invertase Pin-like site-specific DNA recombinase